MVVIVVMVVAAKVDCKYSADGTVMQSTMINTTVTTIAHTTMSVFLGLGVLGSRRRDGNSVFDTKRGNMCILYTIVLGHGLVAILHARHVARLSGTVTTWDILLQYNNKSPNLGISLHQFLFVAFAVAQLYVICLIACYYSISWRVVFSECTANNLLVCFLQQPCGTTFTNTCWDSVCVSVHLRDSL